MSKEDEKFKVQRLNLLSTNGAGSNSPGCSEAEPWVHVCTAKTPEPPVFISSSIVSSGASGNSNRSGFKPYR